MSNQKKQDPTDQRGQNKEQSCPSNQKSQQDPDNKKRTPSTDDRK